MLKDNLGGSWEEACSTLMCEMRMYELECLRRRMEDQILASQQAAELLEAASSQVMSPLAGSSGAGKKNGNVCGSELSPLSPTSDLEAGPSQEFSGISCLLITWKSNPEVEQFKVKARGYKLQHHFQTIWRAWILVPLISRLCISGSLLVRSLQGYEEKDKIETKFI